MLPVAWLQPTLQSCLYKVILSRRAHSPGCPSSAIFFHLHPCARSKFPHSLMFLPFLRDRLFVIIHLSPNLKAGCAEGASAGVHGIELVSDSAHLVTEHCRRTSWVSLGRPFLCGQSVPGSLPSCWPPWGRCLLSSSLQATTSSPAVDRGRSVC